MWRDLIYIHRFLSLLGNCVKSYEQKWNRDIEDYSSSPKEDNDVLGWEEALQLTRNRFETLFESENNKIWRCLGGSDG